MWLTIAQYYVNFKNVYFKNKGENFKRKNLPTIQQLHYLMALYELPEKTASFLIIQRIILIYQYPVSHVPLLMPS